MSSPAIRGRAWVVIALMLSSFMSAVEATVVATAMPTVIAELKGIELYGWVSAAYLLGSTVTVPLYGKLADLRGRRWVFIFSLLLFLIGSLASGAAMSIEQLVLARALQGIGAGGIQPVALTILGDLYSVEERGKVQGAFGAIWAISAVVGPLLGGLIVEVASWRWIFWFNGPVGVAAILVFMKVYQERPRAAGTGRIDILGATFLTAGASLLLLGAGGTWLPFSLLLGVGVLVAFVAIEGRAADPILPPALLVERQTAVASISAACLGAAMMSLLVYLPLYVQGVLGGTPRQAGSTVGPLLLGWPIASFSVVRVITKIGFRWPIWVGSLLSAGAVVAVAFETRAHASMLPIGAAMFVFGLGLGLANTALLLSVQSSVHWERRGVVTALNMFARTMGGTLGVGALGGALAVGLASRLDPDRVAALLNPERHATETIADPAVTAALDHALTPLFWVLAGLALLNLVVVAFYPRSAPTVAHSGPSAPALETAH